MTNITGQSAKENWICRILVLLRRGEVWQLREIYYMIVGYLNASWLSDLNDIGNPGDQSELMQ
mgnify:FL=1